MELRSTKEASAAKGRLASVDALRGIAVLAVMLSHLPFSLRGLAKSVSKDVETYPGPLLTAVSRYGAYGVHLFLVISGFCIHMAWSRRTELPDASNQLAFIPFWRRRLTRLYPPYVVAVAGSLAALAGINLILGASHDGIGGLFGYPSTLALVVDCLVLLLLLQNLTGASQRVGNGPFWSLALEEQLYLLYFLLLRLRRRSGWPLALALVWVVTLAWRAVGQLVVPVGWGSAWMSVGPALWGCWALGALAVEAHHGRVKLPTWFSHRSVVGGAFAIAIACDLPIEGPGYRFVNAISADLAFGVASFLLVHAAVSRDSWWAEGVSSAASWARHGRNLLIRLGAVSYSVYLTHGVVFKVSKQLLMTLHLPPLLVLVGRFLSGLVVGVLFFVLIERRFIARARQVGLKQTPPDGPTGQAPESLPSRPVLG